MKKSLTSPVNCSRSESVLAATSVFRLQSEAEDFVELFLEYRNERTSVARRAVEVCLMNFFSREAMRAMMCLLETADEQTIRLFARTQLCSDADAERASVSVTVIPNPHASKSWGNTGRYFIIMQKEGQEERILHFTNQASAVYYLMFLIHRSKVTGKTEPVSLSKNRETFIQLYHQVYDIADATLRKRVEHLLYREVDGMKRAGRLNELRLDIRKNLEATFTSYDESYKPYAMTARSHLSIPPERILFEGDAKVLLDFNFK